MTGNGAAVSRSATLSMSKGNQEAIRTLEGLGVEGDAHAGAAPAAGRRLSLPCRKYGLGST